MSKHTPGRWWINEKRHNDYPTKISIETDSYNICLVDGGANASLIAAAPDLLEALDAALFDAENTHPLDSNYSWTDAARKAIARAKGESS